ncbi:MAG: aldose 1-epimerase [Isosphaeraceae bacterium]|nr:aldose 1-epimerase [Isosphaeraceae bacterium]
MAYRVGTESHGGRTVYTLQDESSGARAAILPSYGFNLFDLRLPLAGEVRRVIDASPDFADNPRNAGRNGTPVLFPYPNRVRAGRFTFQGKDYTLPVTHGPNAIHGFALDASWDVIEHKATATEATITGRYQISKNSPEMRSHWPTDAILQIRYALSGRRLSMTINVSNPTDNDLPYGFGIHPYFRLPFRPNGDLTATSVVLPAAEYWVLEEFLPTGEKRPVDDRLDFRKGKPIKGLAIDDVFGGLEYEGDRAVCRLIDRALNCEFRLSFDKPFRELVAYTPPGSGDIISLEPYTQTTDAVNLQPKGIDAGLRVLGHGRQDTLSITMETADN